MPPSGSQDRKNRARDERVAAELRAEGWTVIRFCEHDIKNDPEKLAGRGETHRKKAGPTWARAVIRPAGRPTF